MQLVGLAASLVLPFFAQHPFVRSLCDSSLAWQVEYESTVDLAPYTSNPRSGPHLYDLYALIVHYGRSVSSGHYVAYVKAPNGYWWLCDDTNIKQVCEL